MTELTKLKKLFYDKKEGFVNSNKLYHKAKENKINVTYKDVLDFYNKQPINQLMKRIVKPKKYSSIIASYKGEYYQCDIIVYDRFKYHNYKYILCVIDIYSRYAEARAMTNRKAETILEKFKSIIDTMGKPDKLECDNEFNNRLFTDYLDKEDIQPIFSDPNAKNKNSIVERFNGTLTNQLQKIRLATNDYNWKLYLPDVIYNYNHTKHSTIKQTPISMWEGKTKSKQKIIYVPNPFHINDKIRIKRIKKTFDKIDTIKLSKDIYIIEKMEGNKIKLYDVQKLYKPNELYKINDVDELEQPIEEPETEIKQNKIDQLFKRLDINNDNIIKPRTRSQNIKIID